MILNNQLQDTLADIRFVTKSVNQLEIGVPNAADVLHFVQHTSNVASAIGLESIIPFARHIPALSGNILELHFDRNSVDFATRLNLKFDKDLIRRVKSNYYNLPFINNNFKALIKQEKDVFNYGIENMWIEYDAPFNCAPALFFDINRNDAFRPKSVYSNLQQITDVFGYCINERLLQYLEQVKQAGLYVVYYGLMFSRDAKSIRLTINGIQAWQLTNTLRSIGWKGNYKILEKLTATYLKSEQKLVIGIDFENNVEDRIGIEVFDNNYTAFMQILYNNQHVNKAHVDLLNTWQQRVKLPEHLSSALTQLHQRPIDWLYTRINHFKFVIDNTKAIAVKGYLYYCF